MYPAIRHDNTSISKKKVALLYLNLPNPPQRFLLNQVIIDQSIVKWEAPDIRTQVHIKQVITKKKSYIYFILLNKKY